MKPTQEQVVEWAVDVFVTEFFTPSFVDKLERFANLAFAAGQASKVPEGWKLVPVEPTLDMGWAYLDAARESTPDNDHCFSHSGYRAMIAAAPSQEAGE
jgi:hypothetical protein